MVKIITNLLYGRHGKILNKDLFRDTKTFKSFLRILDFLCAETLGKWKKSMIRSSGADNVTIQKSIDNVESHLQKLKDNKYDRSDFKLVTLNILRAVENNYKDRLGDKGYTKAAVTLGKSI